MTTPASNHCFRCGYDLQGIPDERPCPECGLLAERSRRHTDELRDARPRWLRSLAMGIWLILFGLLLVGGWPVLMSIADKFFREYELLYGDTIQVIVLVLATSLIAIGAFLCTRPEGYPPADQLDGRRRISIRLASLMPLLSVGLVFLMIWLMENTPSGWLRYQWMEWLVTGCLTIGCVPFPALGFRQRKSLAIRARSRHLAEHCTIVGIGMSAALALVFGMFIGNYLNWGMDDLERARSVWPMALTGVATTLVLFWLWSMYLAIRFALSFGRAARQARQKWLAADMSR